MLTIADHTLEQWLREDLPYCDLTTHMLGLGDTPGRMIFKTREDIVVCGTEEAFRILQKSGSFPEPAFRRSGTRTTAGEQLLVATGTAESLHAAWKICANLLEHASGIATRTRRMVDTANAAAPAGRHISVAVTRKGFPGAKELAIKAVLAGGGFPHRLGLSETLLIFPQHRSFLPPDALAEKISELRSQACEKKLIVEACTADEARRWASLGADGVQFDKLTPALLAPLVTELRATYPRLLLLAAGGINQSNTAAYAATGVDVLVTSSLHYSEPADIGVTLSPA
ncbi:MAG: ModD protein [Opitutaceae bacterium]|jgi:molybdenum transport protein